MVSLLEVQKTSLCSSAAEVLKSDPLYALWVLQLVQSVTELVISELLWLNYSSPEKPIYLYINSTGGLGGGAGVWVDRPAGGGDGEAAWGLVSLLSCVAARLGMGMAGCRGLQRLLASGKGTTWRSKPWPQFRRRSSSSAGECAASRDDRAAWCSLP